MHMPMMDGVDLAHTIRAHLGDATRLGAVEEPRSARERCTRCRRASAHEGRRVTPASRG
jgi:hypothetical protein